MSEEEFDVVALTKANANQLNAADIASGAITVRVTGVKNNKSADGKQPIAVSIDGGYKPWMPCLTVRRLLIKAWGNPATWKGRRVTLYNDPEVTYGKDKTGGIRVSHLTDINRPIKVTLPVRRGVYQEYTILPMESDPVGRSEPARTPPQSAYATFVATLAAAKVDAEAVGEWYAATYPQDGHPRDWVRGLPEFAADLLADGSQLMADFRKFAGGGGK